MGSRKVSAGCRQTKRQLLGIAMVLGLLLLPGVARAANLHMVKDGTGTILAFSMAVMPPVAAECGSQCDLAVPAGSRVTITAVADAATTFLGWSEGGCAGNLLSCDITLTTDLSLTAYFSDGNGPPAPPADVVPPLTTATPPGGIHTTPVDVTLAANEEVTIHYTVDGSSPSRQSPVYTGPVRITPSGVLRFFAVDAAGNVEAEQEERYLFLRGDVDASRQIGLADTIAALDAQTDRRPTVDLRSDVDGDKAIGAGESFRPLQVLTLPDGEALITDLPPPRVAMAASALGSVTFSRDGAHTATATYPADGKAFHLQITDGAGRLWSLDIPGDALLLPTSIRISALKDIASPTMPGVIGAGVFLEPDGLKFLAPATLTVTPPAGGSPGMLLLGSGLGDNLEFAPSVAGQGSVSTSIWHFSTAYVSDDAMNALEQQAMDALKERAMADYASAKAAAAELLGQKPITAPAPPDLSFNCYGTAAYKEPAAQLARYEKEVFSPENAVMARLLGVGRSLALLGDEAKSQELLQLAGSVNDRIMTKTRTLMKTYAPQPDKYLAVSRVVLAAERNSQLLGSTTDGGTFAGLASWAVKVRDHYIDRLRQNHDYRVLKALMPLERDAQLLGSTDNAIQRIMNAMHFTAYFDTAARLSGHNILTYHLNGDVSIDRTENNWAGEGTGDYQSFTCTDPEITMILPNPFPVLVGIEDVDVCVDGMARLTVSAIGADVEIYKGPDGTAPASPGEIQAAAEIALAAQWDAAKGYYRFELPVSNSDPETGRKTFTNSIAGGAIDFQYELKLMHTPK